MYEAKRFPYDGTIDADGHVLEPDWLWEHYLEPEHRDRALRITVDAPPTGSSSSRSPARRANAPGVARSG